MPMPERRRRTPRSVLLHTKKGVYIGSGREIMMYNCNVDSRSCEHKRTDWRRYSLNARRPKTSQLTTKKSRGTCRFSLHVVHDITLQMISYSIFLFFFPLVILLFFLILSFISQPQEESLTFQSILDGLEAELLKYREELNRMQILNNEAQISKKAAKVKC